MDDVKLLYELLRTMLSPALMSSVGDCALYMKRY